MGHLAGGDIPAMHNNTAQFPLIISTLLQAVNEKEVDATKRIPVGTIVTEQKGAEVSQRPFVWQQYQR